MNTAEVLTSLGLEEKQAKVYLALLTLGETTATRLAEATGLDRTLMYQLTNKLIEGGLVSYIVKNNVRYFSAADPEVILRNLHEKEEHFTKILPELKQMQKTLKQETKVEVYRGREGISTVFKMVLQDKKNYYLLGGGEGACKNFELLNKVFIRKAFKLGMKGRILERKNAEFFVGRNEQYRFIADPLIASTTLCMWGKKMAILVWSEPYYAILIDNKEVTESNLATFNYLWTIAEKPSKKDKEKRTIK